MVTLPSLLTGLGLFLFGMLCMTDGLKALAGDALRAMLLRFVRGPWSGLCSGALATALVQSSTATTVTTIGFVSAGLLTFHQALGVIFGANLGTTSTGWLVSWLGFQVSLGSVAGPLVLLGVSLRLLLRGRRGNLGTAVVGFGLLFLGIDLLQHGMAGMAEHFDLTQRAAPGFLDRLLMVGIGVLLTVVVQSSSAAMATTLAAVSSQAITLEQAAAVAIGQNIGTTLTAGLASLGAPTAAQRTALAHVLFNGFTGAVAVLLLPWLLVLVRAVLGAGPEDAAIALAGFHTVFNLLGVALLLPLLGPFARLIEHLVVDRSTGPARFLGSALASVGPIAQAAVQRALAEVRVEAAATTGQLLAGGRRQELLQQRLEAASAALGEVRQFLERLGEAEQSPAERQQHLQLLHATDHLGRLLQTLPQAPLSLRQHTGKADPALTEPVHRLQATCEAVQAANQLPDASAALAASAWLAERRRSERRICLEQAALGQLDVATAMARIDALVWLDQIGYHLARSGLHLQGEPASLAAPTP